MISFVLLSLISQAELSLETFLQQVQNQNQSHQAATLGQRGGVLRAKEGNLVVLPTLYADGSYTKDELIRSTTPVSLESEWRATVGIRERTPIGLDVQLSTTYLRQNFYGFTVNPHHTHQYELTVSGHLWRNILGSETRAQRNAMNNSAKSSSYADQFQKVRLLVNAEVAYEQLLISRANRAQQEESLKRAEKLVSWNRRKNRQELINDAALAQTEANLNLRKLALQNAIEMENAAALELNSLRQVEGTTVEKLTDQRTEEELLALVPLEKSTLRYDLESELRQHLASANQAQLSLDKNRPDLQAYGSFRTQGQSTTGRTALEDATGFDNRGYTVGLNLSVPLTLLTMNDTTDGWNYQRKAAELRAERVKFDDQKAWHDLVRRFGEAKERLKLRAELERSNNKRVNSEQNLWKKGRSTLFELIESEQDFSDSQFLKLQAALDVLSLYAQMKFYQ